MSQPIHAKLNPDLDESQLGINDEPFPGKATINKVLSSASSTFAMMSQSLRVSVRVIDAPILLPSSSC